MGRISQYLKERFSHLIPHPEYPAIETCPGLMLSWGGYGMLYLTEVPLIDAVALGASAIVGTIAIIDDCYLNNRILTGTAKLIKNLLEK